MQTRVLAAILSFCVTVSVASVARAAGGGNGKVQWITVPNGNISWVYVGFNGQTSIHPSCAGSGNDGKFAFDTSTTKGKNLLSVLQNAQISGRTIGFGGTSMCVQQYGVYWEVLDIITMYNY